jgi:hypothetical protein
MPDPHAITRAAERYGLALTIADLDAVMLSITDKKLCRPSTAILQGIQRDGSERWFVDAAGVRVRVAYSPISARVVSVLPMCGNAPTFVNHRLRKQSTRGRGRCERERVEEWSE